MTKLEEELEETVKSELQMFYRMSGVMVQMLMFEAENQNITFQNVEVNSMENYKALEEMKEYQQITSAGQSSGSGFALNPIKG